MDRRTLDIESSLRKIQEPLPAGGYGGRRARRAQDIGYNRQIVGFPADRCCSHCLLKLALTTR
ncbi:hypothetical protein BN2475_580048 [Paraburkholderia ribeironis]|uniref:Uncharacterized protein n=1 Tax=Paraburkholderia ribeironis TaxID=1247936 RepID=A0A1N7SEC5_9BURK|nr:hypothetical protein BN2475_580048 [Paraburkholderia ribeironis]